MDSEVIDRIYRNRFETDKEELDRRNRIWRTFCSHLFQQFIPKDSKILDVACGYCEFLNNIEGKEKIGLDINPHMKKFAGEGVTVLPISFTQMKETLEENAFDVVFCSNFLEHLDSKNQVLQVFENAFYCLKPGGRFIILQPNILYTKERYWLFIDHKMPLTDYALIEAGYSVGMKLVKKISRCLPYGVQNRYLQKSFLAWWYLKLMPWSSFFFGQQSLVIMEK